MRLRAAVATVMTIWLSGAQAVRAQELVTQTDLLIVGTRVRLRAPDLLRGSLKGRVVAVDPDAITVDLDDRMPLRIARSSISQLEVSVGRRRNPLKGALWGAAAGAVIIGGLTEVRGDCVPNSEELCARTRGEAVGTGVAVGVIYGLVGGYFKKTDQWTGVPIERLQVAVRPSVTRDRKAVAVTVGF